MIIPSSLIGISAVPRPSNTNRIFVDIRTTNTIDIRRIQGDTLSLEFAVMDGFSAANLIGWSDFQLTVSSRSRPLEVELFSLAGVVDTSGQDGLISFPISQAQSGNAGRLYYDMQAVNPNGQTVTMSEGVYTVLRDK